MQLQIKREQEYKNSYQEKKKTLTTVIRGKEGHYIMIMRSTHVEDITIVNIYACNIGALKYIKQMLTAI